MNHHTKEKMDWFFAAVARFLSFGEPSQGMGHQDFQADDLCLVDFAHSDGLMNGTLTKNIEPIYGMRSAPFEGRKVEALEVLWCNIPSSSGNPFGDVGYFRARMYFQKTDSTTPPASSNTVQETPPR